MSMAFDYKKEYREFYLPPRTPGLIDVPQTRYIAVSGSGDPNAPDGAYKAAIGLLYGVAFTIKMSPKSGRQIEGYFPYVVPPLEGLWRQAGGGAVDYADKSGFSWISMIRLPAFVTQADFEWAVRQAAEKKGTDFSAVRLFTYDEGLCVQCMHVGPYDAEPETLARMHDFMRENGLAPDVSEARRHHEIYLGDPRRTAPARLHTVLRLPVRRLP